MQGSQRHRSVLQWAATVVSVDKLVRLLAAFVAVALVMVALSVGDADPLSDYCVGDLSSKNTINGLVCMPSATAVAEDFAFRVFRVHGETKTGSALRLLQGSPASTTLRSTPRVRIGQVQLRQGWAGAHSLSPQAREGDLCGERRGARVIRGYRRQVVRNDLEEGRLLLVSPGISALSVELGPEARLDKFLVERAEPWHSILYRPVCFHPRFRN